MTNSPYRTMDDNKRPTEDETLLEGPQPRERHDKEQILVSDPWRVLRIMGEFVWGFDNLSDVRDGVSIFGSARTPSSDPHYQKAVETGRLLAKAGIPVITGGGPGIMEAANRGAMEAKGLSIGCNIELPFEQGANPYLSRSLNFKFFFVRKTMFVKYATAFIVFPGGYGTLDELFEALTLIQTGKVKPMPILFFGREFWERIVNFEALVEEGVIAERDLELFKFVETAEEAWAHICETYAESPGLDC